MHNRRLFRSKSFAKRLKNVLAKKNALHYSYTDDTAKYIVSRWNRDLVHARNCPFFTWVKKSKKNIIHLRDFYNDPDFSILLLLHKRSKCTSKPYEWWSPKPIEKEHKWIFFLSLTITFLIGLIEVKRRQWPLNGMGSSTSPCTRFWWNPIYSPRQSSNACSPFRARASPQKRTPCIWKDKVKKPHSSSKSFLLANYVL